MQRSLLGVPVQPILKVTMDGTGTRRLRSNFLQEEKDQRRYRSARNGDHLMKVPFECDLCHFRNMNKRDPVSRGKRDEDTFVAIMRA